MVDTRIGGFQRDVVQVGAGEVFRNRYVVGNDALPLDRRLRFRNIVDVIPESELRSALPQELAGPDVRIWQLFAPFEDSLKRLIVNERLQNMPVLIAAPTRFHVPYTETVLELGGFVAVEKPIASSLGGIERFRTLLTKHGKNRIFLFAYYLLEKGLPLLVWSRAGHMDDFILNLVTLDGSFANWQEARFALGDIAKIYGVILEGRDERWWVQDPANGGHTIETFYHLLCLVHAILPSDAVTTVTDVRLARDSKVPAKQGPAASNEVMGETLTSVSMNTSSGVGIELIMVKCVPTAKRQRWLFVECERGSVWMNFETQRLDAKGSGRFLSSSLKWRSKYATQFMLLTEKLKRPELPIEDETLLRALVQAIEIRESGTRSGIGRYQGGYFEQYMNPRLAYLVQRGPT